MVEDSCLHRCAVFVMVQVVFKVMVMFVSVVVVMDVEYYLVTRLNRTFASIRYRPDTLRPLDAHY